VPAAIIALKQGLGRLIRTKQDRGVLAILDSRLLRKPYGRLFLVSLPPCPVTQDRQEVVAFMALGKVTR
jgi:ATP-dependent DNA helicase DinG